MKTEMTLYVNGRCMAAGMEFSVQRWLAHAASCERAKPKAPMMPLPIQRVVHRLRACGIGVLAVVAAIACTPRYQEAYEVEANPPRVSYEFSSDTGLIEANNQARVYCSQYAATPSIRGEITNSPDDTQTVTFTCIKTVAVTTYPSPAPPPTSYIYRTDVELLQAIESTDAYCAQSGRIASSSITIDSGGTRTLTYQCVPR